MAAKRRLEVVTFKADSPLVEALDGIPNRSEFIRAAIASALEGVCPLCGGAGTLDPHQRRHWKAFVKTHTLGRCKECRGITISCGALKGKEAKGAGDYPENPQRQKGRLT